MIELSDYISYINNTKTLYNYPHIYDYPGILVNIVKYNHANPFTLDEIGYYDYSALVTLQDKTDFRYRQSLSKRGTEFGTLLLSSYIYRGNIIGGLFYL